MKRKIFIGLAIFAAIWVGYRSYRMTKTLTHSPVDTVQFSSKDLNITVTYGRPYKNGRLIFGEAKDRWFLPKGRFWTDGFRLLTGLPRTTGALVPNGQYWRLGANNATEISFSRNIDFAGKRVSAGKYRMYSVPGQDFWRVTLNSEVGKFGYHEPNYSLDVVTIIVPVETTKSETEQFTIRFEKESSAAKMEFLWDKTLVAIPISRTD